MCVVIYMYCGFTLQKNALLQYGEYAAQLPKATEKVSNVIIMLWYQVT